MANQFDRRGPPERLPKGHSDATKDKIRAEMLSKRLEKYAKAKGKAVDKYRMEPAQVQAAKVLIDRGKPMLQAITQEILNPLDQMSEEEIQQQAKALIISNPALVLAALDADPGLRAAVLAHITQKPALVGHEQVTYAA